MITNPNSRLRFDSRPKFGRSPNFSLAVPRFIDDSCQDKSCCLNASLHGTTDAEHDFLGLILSLQFNTRYTVWRKFFFIKSIKGHSSN